MTCSQGSASQLAFDTDATFDASSVQMDYLYETVHKQGRIVGAQGISGTRSRYVARTREGAYTVGGRVVLQPGPLDLDTLLPFILGASEAADVFDLAELIPSFSVLIDKVGSIFQYDGCKMNRAILRAVAGPGDSEQELVELILEVVGQTETKGASWPGTIPSLVLTANRAPYILSDGVVTIGSAYEIKTVAIVVDNFLQPRWVNSLYPTEICPRDRRVMMVTENPFTATEYAAFYGLATQFDGTSGTFTLTNGSYSTTFTMPGLQWADQTPMVKGKLEIPLHLMFEARRTAGAAELTVTNVST